VHAVAEGRFRSGTALNFVAFAEELELWQPDVQRHVTTLALAGLWRWRWVEKGLGPKEGGKCVAFPKVGRKTAAGD
jgi:hypothetical protein